MFWHIWVQAILMATSFSHSQSLHSTFSPLHDVLINPIIHCTSPSTSRQPPAHCTLSTFCSMRSWGVGDFLCFLEVLLSVGYSTLLLSSNLTLPVLNLHILWAFQQVGEQAATYGEACSACGRQYLYLKFEFILSSNIYRHYLKLEYEFEFF